MASFQQNDVYYTYQGQNPDENMHDHDDDAKMPKEEALIKAIKFIREWKHENKYIYR